MKEKSIKDIHTDLILEKNLEGIITEKSIKNDKIKVIKSKYNSNDSTTIYFEDITDKNNYNQVLDTVVEELKEYIKIKKSDTILVIGLGNENSTPDSLGPSTIDNILVTRYLFLLGEVEDGYSNVCTFTPNVLGNTGIETMDIIKSIIDKTSATKVIIIDALKTNNIDRLVKTIQITNQGISPGSGVNNNRKEISKKTTGIDVIAIGVPTVVDIQTIIEKYTNKKLNIKENFIVTPTNIDFLIEKLALLLGNSINISLHKNYYPTK